MLIKLLTVLFISALHQSYGLPTDIGGPHINKDNGDTESASNTTPTTNEFVEEVKKSIPHWPMSVKSKYVSVIPDQIPDSEIDPREPEKNQLIQTRSTKILPPASPDLDTADYSIPYNRGKTISSDPEDSEFRFPELPSPVDSKIQEFRESSDEYKDGEDDTEMLKTRALGAENIPFKTLQSESSFLNNIPEIPETLNSIEIPEEINKREELNSADSVQTGFTKDQKLPTNAQPDSKKPQILSENGQTKPNADQNLLDNVEATHIQAEAQKESANSQTGFNDAPKLPENVQIGLDAAQKLPANVQTGLDAAQKPPSTAVNEDNNKKGENLPEATQTAGNGGQVPTNNVQIEPTNGVIKPSVQDTVTQTDSNPGVNEGIPGENSNPDLNSQDTDEDETFDKDSLFPTPTLLMKIMRLAGIPPPGRCRFVVISGRPIGSFRIPSQPQFQPQPTDSGPRTFLEPFRPVQNSQFRPSRFFAQPTNSFFNPVPSYYDQTPNPVNPLSFLFSK